MPPNLLPLRLLAERAMPDACTVTRDAGGVEDDTLNESTGALTTVGAATVYTGRCLVSQRPRLPAERTEGDAVFYATEYVLSLPMSAPDVSEGDLVTVTSSRWDTARVGKVFRVTTPYQASLAVTRDAALELLTQL